MSQDQQTTVERQFTSVDPEGTIVKTFPFLNDEELKRCIEKSNVAYKIYRKATFAEKKEKLLKLADIIEKTAEEDAKLICNEIGKPYQQALAEVKKSAGHCRFYAEQMEQYLKPQLSEALGANQKVIHESVGAVYIITPFNFPHWQIFKPAIANIALGNTLLVRTADSTPLVGLNVEQKFREAGFGDVYQNVFTKPSQLEMIISSPVVKCLSFTGSTGAGKFISSMAGKYLKKTVMELGGSDPFIVLEDADLELAATLAVKARFLNCGQVCIASKRFLICDSVYDQFLEKVLKKVEEMKVGNPLEEGVFLGPMARKDLLENIQNQVQKSLQQGGSLLAGGFRISERPGFFFQPTVIEVMDDRNILMKEEVFGPVMTLLRVQNAQQAIDIANKSEYGLGGVIISQNIQIAQQYANELETGMVFINELAKTDSRFPVGGTKNSGYGRECGEFGIKEFSNIKLVWTQNQ